MKKLLLPILMVVIFASISFSQIGFKAGGNLANQSNEFGTSSVVFESESIIGFLVGVNYEAKVSESLAFRPGLQFSSKGNSMEVNGIDGKSIFNYLEVPVDLVFNIGDLDIHAGPYAALLISAKAADLDIEENIQPIDAGLNFGLGYSIGNIGLGANYGFGLSNISDYGQDGSIKNKVFSIYLTYTL